MGERAAGVCVVCFMACCVQMGVVECFLAIPVHHVPVKKRQAGDRQLENMGVDKITGFLRRGLERTVLHKEITC